MSFKHAQWLTGIYNKNPDYKICIDHEWSVRWDFLSFEIDTIL